MSRERVHEVSSPISLFPFIGILLCTMGALLVVLVAVSRSARTTAEQQVATKQKQSAEPEGQPKNDEVSKKLDTIANYDAQLNAVRDEAERRLRNEQLRLGHVEDHIRRLREKLLSLNSAALELEALQEEHYDDRKQAEREVDRLQQLIGDAQKTIKSLRDEAGKEKRSYAVVPFKGENGTFRRPIYIECTKNELVLQPEGVRISADDLRPPYGPGNPLATVLRAVRDYLISLNPQFGTGRDAQPYPLLLVRPDGGSYPEALKAIESGDFDVGMELVESDWKLKFPPVDAQLAGIAQQALEQARARQRLLAAAAPRAYSGDSRAAVGDFEFDNDDDAGGGGVAGPGGGPRAARRGGERTYTVPGNRRPKQEQFGDIGQTDDATGGGPSNGDGGSESDANSGDGHNSGAARSSGVPGGTARAPGGAAGPGGAFGSGGGGAPSKGVGDKNLVPEGFETSQSGSAIAGSPAPPDSRRSDASSDPRSERERIMSAEHRGKDWALKQKPAQSVPVRRTIRVAVKNDQLAILPDSGTADAAAGTVIKMPGDTVEAIDELVKQVRDHIDGWGIAGNGLYWRPVVMLNVGPDGQRRADDLTRLLRNSGLDVRSEETARNLPQGTINETR